jgi:hypothetical protein
MWLLFAHQSCLGVLDALPLLPVSSVVGRKFDGGMVDVTCKVFLCVQWLRMVPGRYRSVPAAGLRHVSYHLDRRL